jgi:hypothetical protein
MNTQTVQNAIVNNFHFNCNYFCRHVSVLGPIIRDTLHIVLTRYRPLYVFQKSLYQKRTKTLTQKFVYSIVLRLFESQGHTAEVQ